MLASSRSSQLETELPSAGKHSAPRILIDARMVGAIPHGISRYVSALAKGLHLFNQKNTLSYQPIYLVHQPARDSLFKTLPTVKSKYPFLHFKEQIEIPALLKQLKIALYHSPSFSSLLHCPCPSLITIHDLNHLTYGSALKKLYYQTLLKRFARNSQAILTVSEFSKAELQKWLHPTQAKIQVVYNAVESDSLAQDSLSPSAQTNFILKKFSLTSKGYFYCLSNSKPHKNISLLIEAYQQYFQEHPNAWPLVITATPSHSFPNIIATGPLCEADSKLLLQHAGGMLFPSLYEGFGLPPIEAALQGIPLAISDIPPHREGLSELKPNEILWANPRIPQEWKNAFFRLQCGHVSPPSLESRTKMEARFTVQNLTTKMDQIYRDVLQK